MRCSRSQCRYAPLWATEPDMPAFCLWHHTRNELAAIGFVYSWAPIPLGVRSVSGVAGWARFLAVATETQIAAFAAAMWQVIDGAGSEVAGEQRKQGDADAYAYAGKRGQEREPVRSLRADGGPARGVGPVRAAAVARSLLAGGAVVRRRA